MSSLLVDRYHSVFRICPRGNHSGRTVHIPLTRRGLMYGSMLNVDRRECTAIVTTASNVNINAHPQDNRMQTANESKLDISLQRTSRLAFKSIQQCTQPTVKRQFNMCACVNRRYFNRKKLSLSVCGFSAHRGASPGSVWPAARSLAWPPCRSNRPLHDGPPSGM